MASRTSLERARNELQRRCELFGPLGLSGHGMNPGWLGAALAGDGRFVGTPICLQTGRCGRAHPSLARCAQLVAFLMAAANVAGEDGHGTGRSVVVIVACQTSAANIYR
jgi:hypothetical protein